jgi:hypothetical protein
MSGDEAEENDQSSSGDGEEKDQSSNSGGDEKDQSSNSGDIELSDEGKEKVEQMREAYDDDRETAVLPGTDGTITGVAINEWLDDDGNPKFGQDEKQEDGDQPDQQQEDGDQPDQQQEDSDKQKEDAS